MTAQFARPQQRGRSGIGQAHEPHAALLIDFDNVTMGIRSDLTKELKNLLNSDIIKGKVAVQRAYADWRRYPQYIVPLAESSVDLIFAPAYGSAKKNATDIRLAIDAIELVFTRPEIGTIILLSGDSDFSSMVLKLKEYGKYVIGVGIRESASDLLVQNCDEYYSYSALTGLTRAGDEVPAVSEDPWELVEMSLRQMRENDDVMRSDRLKQVLLELDPNFDEKALGFQKFNKFLQEAASRGLLSLRKQDNGQFEIGPPDATAVAESQAEARGEGRRGRGRRGRGRRDEGRRDEGRERVEGRRDQPQPAAALAAAPVPVVPPPPSSADAATLPAPPAERTRPQPAQAKPAVEPVRAKAEPAKPEVEPPKPKAEAAPKPEPVSTTPDRARQPPELPKPPAATQRAEPERAREAAGPDVAFDAPPAAREGKPAAAADLAASYELLRRAASDLVKKSGQAARDSDVKRRMLELESGWDESALGFSKFSRFLRQAHDAEVITLRKGENGVYDVLPGNGEAARAEGPAGAERERERDRDRGRGRGRGGRERPERARPGGAVDGTRAPEAAAASGRATAPPGGTAAQDAVPPARPAAVPREEGVAPTERAQPTARAAAAPQQPTPPAPPAAPVAQAPTQAPTAPAGQKTAAPAALQFRRGSRGRGAGSGPPPLLEGQTATVRPSGQKPAAAPAQQEAAPAPAAAAAPAREPERRPGEGPPESVAVELGLPQDPGAVASYIATNYRGVGPRSVQTLIDEFGAGRVFDALQKLPDRVRELLGASRGDRLLAAWQDDARRRRGEDDVAPAPAAGETRKPATRAAKAGAKSPTKAKRAPAKAAGAAQAARAPSVVTPSSPAARQSRGGRGSRGGKPPTK